MNIILKTTLKYNLHLLLLSVVTWGLYAYNIEFFSDDLPLPYVHHKILFTTICTFSLFAILKSLNFFDNYRMIPRKSDFALFFTAISLTSIFQHVIFILFFGRAFTSIFSLIAFSTLFSFLIFFFHYSYCYLLIKFGCKKKIVLDVLPDEKEKVIEDFQSLGEAFDHIEFLSKNDLREHVLRAEEKDIDLIVISRDAHKQFELDALLIKSHLSGIPIVDTTKIAMTIPGRVRLSDIEGWAYLLGALPQTTFIRFFGLMKRIIEPVAALLLGVAFLPVIIALSIIIKRTSKGPIFYKQVRTGYLGKNFVLIKFRSMYTDAEVNGPQWASNNDSRITKIGKLMRDTRLDELPQLWNIIKGDMGFIGPRPERPEIYRELKKEIPLFSLRTVVRPGITGWAQVCAGYAASVEESRTKLEYDLFYIQNLSPRLDLIVAVKTILVALFGEEKVVSRTKSLKPVKTREVTVQNQDISSLTGQELVQSNITKV